MTTAKTYNNYAPTIIDIERRRGFKGLSSRRDNDWHRRGMAIRYRLQCQEEEVYTYERVADAHRYRYQRTLRRQGIHCKVFPQPGGICIFIHRNGDNLLPTDEDELRDLIDGWIAKIPEGIRTGGTRGFGGKYAGCWHRGSQPGKYLTLREALDEVKEQLDKDGVTYIDLETDAFAFLGLESEPLEEYCRKSFKIIGK